MNTNIMNYLELNWKKVEETKVDLQQKHKNNIKEITTKEQKKMNVATKS